MNVMLAKMYRVPAQKQHRAYAKIKLLLPLFFFIITISVSAQSKTVTGTVTGETDQPLPSVNVKVKTTGKGTLTDKDGNYSIETSPGSTLVFSYVGYETAEVKIGNASSYNVHLKSTNQSLEQVVVIGYGTQKRTTLTGAIASVSSKTLNELPVPGIDQALQGRVSGLTVTNNGSPGSSPIIAIRGISSITSGTSPLYVIDGFPTGSLNTFDSRDVESVEVLKDASAAAIYGSRGTSGVIMITTKKGRRNGKLQVNLESYVGYQSPSKKINLLNTEQYVQYATTLLGGAANLPPRLQAANFNKPVYAGAAQTFAQTNTDWQDEYFRKNAVITAHNISLNGGNEMSRLYLSAGYFNQDGIAQGLGYKRGNFRINSDHLIGKRFTFGENLYLANADQQFEGTGGNRSPLANVIRIQPYLPVYNPNNNGGFFGPISSFDGSDPTNPVEPAILHEYHGGQIKILGSAFVEARIMPWLKFRSQFGIDYSNNLSTTYIPVYNDGGTLSTTQASIGRNRDLYSTLLYTQQLTFDKTFAKHHIAATAVYENQGQKYNGESASGKQADNIIKTLNGATNLNTNYVLGEWFLQSYIGRLTYDYAGKYLLSAAMRRDGLSIWAPGKKYGNFPSVSVGWRLDQEPFMKNVKQVSELKLRAGYGKTGVDGVTAFGAYPWQATINQNASEYAFGTTFGAPTASIAQGSFFNSLENRDLNWEVTKQYNIGLDLGLFNNRLSFVAEYYKRQSDNNIIGVPTSFSQGFNGGGVLANVAKIRNIGLEFQASYRKTKGPFKWEATGLIFNVRNKVLALNTEGASISAGSDADFGNGDITRTVVGEAVQSFYGYVTDGLFQNADQIASSAFQPGAYVGDIKFKDINGDGKIDDGDRTFLGSFIPKFNYSFNYSFNYKSFDGSIFLQGVQGNKVFNGSRVLTEGMVRLFNAGTAVLDAWTPSNPNTNIPRAINSDPNKNSRVSNRWIEDGSYLRVKNIMFGYNISESVLKSITKGAVSRFRIYVSSQNLLTFTQYKGWDPEVGNRRGALTNGIDYGQYPSARSFQLGLQVGF